jgi:hypothetical protein
MTLNKKRDKNEIKIRENLFLNEISGVEKIKINKR